MKKFITILSIFFFVFPQNEAKITILRLNHRQISSSIEEKLISSVIQLYNKQNQEKLSFQFSNQKNLDDLFSNLKVMKANDLVLAIGQLSLSNERQKEFDYSSVYMQVKMVVMGHKKNKASFGSHDYHELAVLKGSSQESFVKLLVKDYQFTLKLYESYDNLLQDFQSNKVKFALLDNIDLKTLDFAEIKNDLSQFSNSANYVIYYPKNSGLKNNLDDYLKYYIKSAYHQNEMKLQFGSEAYQFISRSK